LPVDVTRQNFRQGFHHSAKSLWHLAVAIAQRQKVNTRNAVPLIQSQKGQENDGVLS
jgi:hypothetical protein